MLIDQAEALHDRLIAERRRWYGYPVMEARMERLCKRAMSRYFRRLRDA